MLSEDIWYPLLAQCPELARYPLIIFADWAWNEKKHNSYYIRCGTYEAQKFPDSSYFNFSFTFCKCLVIWLQNWMRSIRRNPSSPSKPLTYQFYTKPLNLQFKSLWISYISIIKFNKSLQRKDSGARMPHLHLSAISKYGIRSAISFLMKQTDAPAPSAERLPYFTSYKTQGSALFCWLMIQKCSPQMAGLVSMTATLPDHCFLFSFGAVKACVGEGGWGRERKGTKETNKLTCPRKSLHHPVAQRQIPSPIFGLTAAAAQHTQLLLLSSNELQLVG